MKTVPGFTLRPLGKEFIIIYNESKKKPFKTCEVCREKGRLAKKRWAASKKIYGTSKVDKIAKECEEYNRVHGAHLTYGKYKELKRQNKRVYVNYASII